MRHPAPGCPRTPHLVPPSRRSKAPNDQALVSTPSEWRAFFAAVKAGEFDV
ncbi:DUF397 domain-containing protein [Actinoplanes sp. NPDC051475]|uniref:DUF397 domain-containing protein n=1 Tax=Actinoplanes sp. NPDC051475 TaxID=3157225 RepID=UPI00344F3507